MLLMCYVVRRLNMGIIFFMVVVTLQLFGKVICWSEITLEEPYWDEEMTWVVIIFKGFSRVYVIERMVFNRFIFQIWREMNEIIFRVSSTLLINLVSLFFKVSGWNWLLMFKKRRLVILPHGSWVYGGWIATLWLLKCSLHAACS